MSGYTKVPTLVFESLVGTVAAFTDAFDVESAPDNIKAARDQAIAAAKDMILGVIGMIRDGSIPMDTLGPSDAVSGAGVDSTDFDANEITVPREMFATLAALPQLALDLHLAVHPDEACQLVSMLRELDSLALGVLATHDEIAGL